MATTIKARNYNDLNLATEIADEDTFLMKKSSGDVMRVGASTMKSTFGTASGGGSGGGGGSDTIESGLGINSFSPNMYFMPINLTADKTEASIEGNSFVLSESGTSKDGYEIPIDCTVYLHAVGTVGTIANCKSVSLQIKAKDASGAEEWIDVCRIPPSETNSDVDTILDVHFKAIASTKIRIAFEYAQATSGSSWGNISCELKLISSEKIGKLSRTYILPISSTATEIYWDSDSNNTAGKGYASTIRKFTEEGLISVSGLFSFNTFEPSITVDKVIRHMYLQYRESDSSPWRNMAYSTCPQNTATSINLGMFSVGENSSIRLVSNAIPTTASASATYPACTAIVNFTAIKTDGTDVENADLSAQKNSELKTRFNTNRNSYTKITYTSPVNCIACPIINPSDSGPCWGEISFEGSTERIYRRFDNLSSSVKYKYTLLNDNTPPNKINLYLDSNLTGISISRMDKMGWMDPTGLSTDLTSYCNYVTEVKLGSSLKRLDDRCFVGLSNITSMTVPSSVREIGLSAFLSCRSLTGVTFQSDSTDGGPTFANTYALFGYCNNLENVDSLSVCHISTLSSFTFHTAKVKEIYLPDGLEKIDQYAISDCDTLDKIVFPTSLSSANVNMFYGCAKLGTTVASNYLSTYIRLSGDTSEYYVGGTSTLDLDKIETEVKPESISNILKNVAGIKVGNTTTYKNPTIVFKDMTSTGHYIDLATGSRKKISS